MSKMLILTFVTLFLLTPKELSARWPWQKTKLHILVILEVWPGDSSQIFHANIETEPLTGYKSKKYSIWFNTNEISCEAKVGGAEYSVYTSSFRKNDYLVQFYQSPENGGSVTGSLILPIRKPFPSHVVEVTAKNSQGISYRIDILYSSDKKKIDFHSKRYETGASLSCEVRPT